LYKIFTKRNADGSAHYFAAFVVGVEVLFRLNSGGFGYEYGKYGTMVLLLAGLYVEKRKKETPYIYLAFILLFLPSILLINFPTFNDARQEVSFNLSGPVLLGIAAIYFYKRVLNPAQLRKVFLALLYPIAAMSIFIYFKTGALENLKFTTESNFAASGGFGPNQVSTVFGLGIIIIAAAYFLNIQLFKIKFLNIVLLFAFLVRGLATFSRGGMLAPIAAIIACLVIMSLTDPRFFSRIGKVVYSFLLIGIAGFLGFNYVNDVSGGLLEMRYKGESMYDSERSNLYSGRDEIFQEDLEIFQRNMVAGVGPGMGGEARYEISGSTSAAHVEYSRMLAEHGMFGLAAILILVLFPIKTFFTLRSTDDKILLILCMGFVFVTLGHAAMRIAAPGFIYGLAFIHLVRTQR